MADSDDEGKASERGPDVAAGPAMVFFLTLKYLKDNLTLT